MSSFAILLIGYFKFGDDGFAKAKNISINYVAPLMFLNALMIFQFLASRKTKKINVGFKKFIVGISAVAFDVYIIHCHLFIYEQLIKGNFRWILDYPAASLPFIVIGCALGIYIACTLIGRVRMFLFKVLGIDKLLKLIASKLDKALCWA